MQFPEIDLETLCEDRYLDRHIGGLWRDGMASNTSERSRAEGAGDRRLRTLVHINPPPNHVAQCRSSSLEPRIFCLRPGRDRFSRRQCRDRHGCLGRRRFRQSRSERALASRPICIRKDGIARTDVTADTRHRPPKPHTTMGSAYFHSGKRRYVRFAEQLEVHAASASRRDRGRGSPPDNSCRQAAAMNRESLEPF